MTKSETRDVCQRTMTFLCYLHCERHSNVTDYVYSITVFIFIALRGFSATGELLVYFNSTIDN